MRIERTKNAARNIFFGTLLKLYTTLIPFIMRSAMIYYMGVQYLGLNGLFTSVLSVLNLAELGVGSAMVYSMYKPIVEDDARSICALMRLYRTYYRIIGLIIAIVGLCLTPFVPRLITGELPAQVNIFVLYLLNLSATVLSYWLFAYRNCLFSAHQRGDMTSKIAMVADTIKYICQLYVIIVLQNYYIYVIVALCTQVMSNIITAIASRRMFPAYKPEGRLEELEVKKINKRIADLFTSKIGAVVVNSVDTIVISAFLGLSMLGIYQNYFFIMTSIIGMIEIIFNACTAGIGNSVIVESGEKNYNDLKKFTFIISWISGFCVCCFACLYQPFMELWVGKKLMLNFSAVVCLCIYFYIYEINRLLNTYKDAAGIWHADRFRPLATAGANLTLNLIMVQFWGIYGIILSTVLSMLIVGMPWLIQNLFSTIFQRDLLKSYVAQLLRYVFIVAVISSITYILSDFVRGQLVFQLIVKGIICVAVPNVCFWMIYKNKKEYAEMLIIIERMTHGKIRFRRASK